MSTYNGYAPERSTGSKFTRSQINVSANIRNAFKDYLPRQQINTQATLRSLTTSLTADRPNITNIQLLFPRITPVDYSWTKNIK